MANYSQNVFFTSKDSLTTGDPLKLIKGTEIDAELAEISTAIASKTEGDIPSTTKMVFIETAAPAGWTLNTSYDDRTMIIASSPTDDGTPDTSGSWTISGISVDNHTLLLSEIPSHDHGSQSVDVINSATIGSAGALVRANTTVGAVSQSLNDSNEGGGNGHDHNMTIGSSWRPRYVEVIVCEKD